MTWQAVCAGCYHDALHPGGKARQKLPAISSTHNLKFDTATNDDDVATNICVRPDHVVPDLG